MYSVRRICLAALLCCGWPAGCMPDAGEVERFGRMFTGVFDNFELRRQQSEAGSRISVRSQYRMMRMSDDMKHLHLALYGEHKDPATGAPGLVLAEEVSYSLQQDAGGIRMQKLMHASDNSCTLHWRRVDEDAGVAFAVAGVDASCLPVLAPDTDNHEWRLRLSEQGLALCAMSAACPQGGLGGDWQLHRRALMFRGWMAAHPDGPRPSRPTDRAELTVFDSDLLFLSEGGTHWFRDEGRLTGYGIRLERPYYSEDVRVLKLGVVRLVDDYTLAYTWAAPDSTRIGINLRWLQAGLTLVNPAGNE